MEAAVATEGVGRRGGSERVKVVIAPDSFKGSVRAAAVAEAIATGWREVRPDDEVVLRPMADGGEGTLDAFEAAVPASRRRPVRVSSLDAGRRGAHGAAGDAARDGLDASWLLLPDGTAVVELASTAGIERWGTPLAPLEASTRGFGDAIAAALDHGVERLLLAIGSSASTDAGAGMLQALGARATDAHGRAIGPGVRGIETLERVDLSALRPLPAHGVDVLTDVTSPLRGPSGAAAVFGPQKGLDPAGVARADAALGRVAEILPLGVDPATPGAGAAGGTGFGLLAWGARLVPGAPAVAEAIGLGDAVASADVVITGEGSYDAQSSAGKAPAHVADLAARARQGGVPILLVAGRIGGDASRFAHVVSTSALAGSSGASLGDPPRWLRAAGRELARRV